MYIIISKYKIGDVVVLKTDIDKLERVVVGMLYTGCDDNIQYCLRCDVKESYHLFEEFV